MQVITGKEEQFELELFEGITELDNSKRSLSVARRRQRVLSKSRGNQFGAEETCVKQIDSLIC